MYLYDRGFMGNVCLMFTQRGNKTPQPTCIKEGWYSALWGVERSAVQPHVSGTVPQAVTFSPTLNPASNPTFLVCVTIPIMQSCFYYCGFYYKYKYIPVELLVEIQKYSVPFVLEQLSVLRVKNDMFIYTDVKILHTSNAELELHS